MSKNASSRNLWLIVALSTIILVAGVVWSRTKAANASIDSHVLLPSNATSGQLLLMQRLNQLLRQHPKDDGFRLYWEMSDFCSLEYQRSSQILHFVGGNAHNRCVNATYTGVNPEHIRRVVAKGGKIRTLTQFGCQETSYKTGGWCEITG